MIRHELEDHPESSPFPNSQVRLQVRSCVRRRSHLAYYILGHRSCLPLPVREYRICALRLKECEAQGEVNLQRS